jgi:hypothetical protein
LLYILSKALRTNRRHVDAHETTWWIHEDLNRFEKIFLKDRKEHLIKKIINLLRDKSFDEIDAFESLFLLHRVDVLLSTLIVKNQIFWALKEINIRLNSLEKNTEKNIFILFIYANVTKTESVQSVEFMIVIIATYNNINQ